MDTENRRAGAQEDGGQGWSEALGLGDANHYLQDG